MEPSLRQLGLPTSLQRGIIQVLKEHTICKEGAIISPEQSRLLVSNKMHHKCKINSLLTQKFFPQKLFGHQMAQFKIVLRYVWSKDGSFRSLVD